MKHLKTLKIFESQERQDQSFWELNEDDSLPKNKLAEFSEKKKQQTSSLLKEYGWKLDDVSMRIVPERSLYRNYELRYIKSNLQEILKMRITVDVDDYFYVKYSKNKNPHYNSSDIASVMHYKDLHYVCDGVSGLRDFLESSKFLKFKT